MRENEIREELELGVRSFLEAKERSQRKGLDEFDNLRILEASFNRLFLSVEHLCNAIVILETGNFSKKHFGDFRKLKGLQQKYKADLASIYQTTYNFRSYADYRKCPEIKDRFNKNELAGEIKIVEKSMKDCLNIISGSVDVKDILKRLES